MPRKQQKQQFNAIRLDDEGEVDDVAISTKDGMFRMERMSDDCWWVAVYPGNGHERLTFSVFRDGEKVAAKVIENNIGAEDDTTEDERQQRRRRSQLHRKA